MLRPQVQALGHNDTTFEVGSPPRRPSAEGEGAAAPDAVLMESSVECVHRLLRPLPRPAAPPRARALAASAAGAMVGTGPPHQLWEWAAGRRPAS
jgi:hypothetical protein